jgi:hypothetical protein
VDKRYGAEGSRMKVYIEALWMYVLYLLKLQVFANQALSGAKHGHEERECTDLGAIKIF